MLSIGAKIFGGLSGVLILYLLIGFLLPGSWRAEARVVLPASPEAVFPFLSRADQWARWTSLPESGYELFGPREGAGSGLRWDDPQYGKGQFQIVDSQPGLRLEYEVRVEGGALRVRGFLTLRTEGSGTRLEWSEEGDFGWNPLMGYAARGMAESQSESMRASLDRLRELIAAGTLQVGR